LLIILTRAFQNAIFPLKSLESVDPFPKDPSQMSKKFWLWLVAREASVKVLLQVNPNLSVSLILRFGLTVCFDSSESSLRVILTEKQAYQGAATRRDT
jgi:hypothetical protein